MRARTILVALLTLSVTLTGCIGGTDPGEPATQNNAPDATNTTPEQALPEIITGIEPVTSVAHDNANGLWIQDDIAYVSGGGAGFYTVDVSDPARPIKLGELATNLDGDALYSRDADILQAGNRTIAALAASGAGMHFVDVTDPARPELLSTLDLDASAHNLAVVPGTTLVYNSRSLGDAVEPGIDIVDASDPANPELAKAWIFPRAQGPHPIATTGCHDITIYPEADRAYCAGVTQTYILGIQDPLDPTVEGIIENPLINIHHYALPAQDHELLLIGDEYGGAAAPACFGATTQGERTLSTPTGALWIYDISDPAAPVLQGWLSPPSQAEAPTPCTAHFGRLIEDRPLIAMGWYNAGVLLVDFSDPMSPYIVDQAADGTNVWDVWYTKGHLVTGSIGAGSHILALTGE